MGSANEKAWTADNFMLGSDKILVIDCRMIENSGIGTYLKGILPDLCSAFQGIYLLGQADKLEFLKTKFPYVTIINFTAKIYSIEEQMQFKTKIPACDLFFSPHFNIPLGKINAKKRLVTIHDLNHLQPWFKQSLNDTLKSKLAALLIRRSEKLSQKVICVSEFTKKALVDEMDFDEKKIFVIPLGVDHQIFNTNHDKLEVIKAKERYRISNNYIIYVGNIKPHKNLMRLLQAYSSASKDIAEDLVIVGQQDKFLNRHEEFYKYYHSLNDAIRERIIFTGFVDNKDLPLLLKGASAMIFPSLYEGFGLPPLEAMACGCPTVVSNVTSIPEVCGAASSYFNPYNIADVKHAIISVLNDKTKKDDLTSKGLEHVKLFNWDKCAKEHIRIIKDII